MPGGRQPIYGSVGVWAQSTVCSISQVKLYPSVITLPDPAHAHIFSQRWATAGAVITARGLIFYSFFKCSSLDQQSDALELLPINYILRIVCFPSFISIPDSKIQADWVAADLCLRNCRSHPAHVLAVLTKAVLLTMLTNVVSSKPDFLTS